MKFQLGQTIKRIGHSLSDAGKTIRIVIDESGVMYSIALKDWDAERREMLDAVMHIKEDEAELIEEKSSEENLPEAPTEHITIADTIEGGQNDSQE